jgi:hypothetical protein
MCIPSMHAVVSTPVDLQSASVADFLCTAGLPRLSEGSASATWVSGPRRLFTCVTASIFAGSPSDPFHRRLRRIRYLLRRFGCFWASDPSQAGLAPAEIHTHSRRTDSHQVSAKWCLFAHVVAVTNCRNPLLRLLQMLHLLRLHRILSSGSTRGRTGPWVLYNGITHVAQLACQGCRSWLCWVS